MTSVQYWIKRLRCILAFGGHDLRPIWKTTHSAKLVGFQCRRCKGTFAA